MMRWSSISRIIDAGIQRLGNIMQGVLFSGIRESARAFEPTLLATADGTVDDAAKLLAEDDRSVGAVGFRRAESSKSPADVKRKLKEHGLDVSDRQLDQLMKLQEAEHVRRQARGRFWMQLVISLLVAGFAGAFLAFGTPGASTEKALFGLVGTVLGYWLR